MKNHSTHTDLDLDRLGRHLSAQLSLATPGLPHDISERLRIARQQAMVQRKPVLQSRLASRLHTQGNGTLAASPDEGLNLWSILGSALPLLVLVVGLMLIHTFEEEHVAAELAAIDSALLTDELPPDAYTDAGFIQFLKQGSAHRAAQD